MGFRKPMGRCSAKVAEAAEGGYRGGGGFRGDNFAGKISPLRKVAKFSPWRNFCSV